MTIIAETAVSATPLQVSVLQRLAKKFARYAKHACQIIPVSLHARQTVLKMETFVPFAPPAAMENVMMWIPTAGTVEILRPPSKIAMPLDALVQVPHVMAPIPIRDASVRALDLLIL